MIQLIKKFKMGDPISDSELYDLITHYSILEKELEYHGEVFHLTWKECFHDLKTLESYKKAREKK